MNAASGCKWTQGVEIPVIIKFPIGDEGGNWRSVDYPASITKRRLVYVECRRGGEVIEEDVGRAVTINDHIRELRLSEWATH